MPGLTTHYLFGLKVLHDISNLEIKEKVLKHRGAYALGLQGPDIFFYSARTLSSRFQNLGSTMHKTYTGDFFKNYITGLDLKTGKEKDILLSYFQGFLCHYILDCTAHPYIYYMTGFRYRNASQANQCSANHRALETVIDNIMFKNYSSHPYANVNRTAFISCSKEDTSVISSYLASLIKQTYHLDISEHVVTSCIKNLRHITKLLEDKSGTKEKLILGMEKSFIHYNLISSFMNRSSAKQYPDSLNLAHESWCLPWDDHIVSSASFVDLYNSAALSSRLLLQRCEDYFSWGGELESLLQSIGNRSYHTGEDWTKNLIFQYYKNPNPPEKPSAASDKVAFTKNIF